MSQDYGIDNTGSGFDDFDDDGDDTDLEAMLSRAGKSAEEADEDEGGLFFESSSDEKVKKVHPVPVAPVRNHVEPEPEDDEDNYFTEETKEPFVAPEIEEYREPPVVYVEPEPVFVPTPADIRPTVKPIEESKQRRMNIRTDKEDIAEAKKIINILDTYRKLQSETKNVVSQFICEDEDDLQDESILVVRTLRAEPMLYNTMTALRESASETDRVERVFYVLRLENDVLYDLGELVGTLIESEIENRENKIEYSKKLEEAINGLDRKIIDYVSATQSVLAAAGNE